MIYAGIDTWSNVVTRVLSFEQSLNLCSKKIKLICLFTLANTGPDDATDPAMRCGYLILIHAAIDAVLNLGNILN